MGRFNVGGNADSWCTKCKLILAHTVVAMVGQAPVKAQCNTCGSAHKFRGDAPQSRGSSGEKIKKALTKKNQRLNAGMVQASHYAELMEGREPNKAKRYSAKEMFEKGELIRHPKFGVGIVTVLKDPGKMEIIFETGPKTLVCGKAP